VRSASQRGLGPAWANNLFEDAAEYGYGMAVGVLQQRKRLHQMATYLLESPQVDYAHRGHSTRRIKEVHSASQRNPKHVPTTSRKAAHIGTATLDGLFLYVARKMRRMKKPKAKFTYAKEVTWRSARVCSPRSIGGPGDSPHAQEHQGTTLAASVRDALKEWADHWNDYDQSKVCALGTDQECCEGAIESPLWGTHLSPE